MVKTRKTIYKLKPSGKIRDKSSSDEKEESKAEMDDTRHSPVLWNALPENIKKCETLNCF